MAGNAAARGPEVLPVPTHQCRAGPELHVRVPLRREAETKVHLREVVVREHFLEAPGPQESGHRYELRIHLQAVEEIGAAIGRNARALVPKAEPVPERGAESESVRGKPSGPRIRIDPPRV